MVGKDEDSLDKTVLEVVKNSFHEPDFESILANVMVANFDRTSNILSAVPMYDGSAATRKYVFNINPVYGFTSDKIAKVVCELITQRSRNLAVFALRTTRMEGSSKGWLFEQFFHDIFFRFVSGKRKAPLCFEIRNLESKEIEEVNVSPVEMYRFKSDQYATGVEKLQCKTNVYYYPTVHNFPYLDSFLIQNGVLYMFQCTVNVKHGIENSAAASVLVKLAKIPTVKQILDNPANCRYITCFPVEADVDIGKFTIKNIRIDEDSAASLEDLRKELAEIEDSEKNIKDSEEKFKELENIKESKKKKLAEIKLEMELLNYCASVAKKIPQCTASIDCQSFVKDELK